MLGTDLIGENVWVDAVFDPWRQAGMPPIVIADTRFPNETAAIRRNGGIVVLVQRNGSQLRADDRADSHASERLTTRLPTSRSTATGRLTSYLPR